MGKTLTLTLLVSAALTHFFPSFLSLSLVTQWMQAQLPLTLRPTRTTPPLIPSMKMLGIQPESHLRLVRVTPLPSHLPSSDCSKLAPPVTPTAFLIAGTCNYGGINLKVK